MGEPANCVVLRSEIFPLCVVDVVPIAVLLTVVYDSIMTAVRIIPTTDGPLEVDGEATIVAPDGTVIKETTENLSVPLWGVVLGVSWGEVGVG